MDPSGAAEACAAESKDKLTSELVGDQTRAGQGKPVGAIEQAKVDHDQIGQEGELKKALDEEQELASDNLRARLAREIANKTKQSGLQKSEAPPAGKTRRGLLDALLGDRSWFEQKTVILDIDNSKKKTHEQGHDKLEQAQDIAGADREQEEQEEQEAAPANRQEESQEKPSGAAGKRPPTFGQTPSKVTRLPYYSYHGKARNVNYVSANDRKISSSVDTSDSSASTSAPAATLSSAGPEAELEERKERRQRRGYSNISNLLPGRPMQVRESSSSRRRPPSNSLGLHSQSTSNLTARGPSRSSGKGAQSAQVQLGKRSNSLTNNQRKQPATGRVAATSALDMRRQNSAGAAHKSGSLVRNPGAGSMAYLAGASRPASSLGGAYLGARHQRSPSAGSLHLGLPRSYSPMVRQSGRVGAAAAADELYDPDCPVHGYSPLAGRAATYTKSSQQLGQAQSEADLLYEPYYGRSGAANYAYHERAPVGRPSMGSLYSPDSPSLLPAAGRRAATPAYYSSSNRFNVYHSADRQAASLAPTNEQLRRILGYQPHTKPIHLHPQWAYSRPFIHLQSGARSPSPANMDDYDPVSVASEQPRFLPFNQLLDTQAVRAVDFHPNGEVYAVGSNSRALRICAYPAEHELRQFNPDTHITSSPRVLFKFLQVHRGSIYCVAFNATGQLLATGSNDQTVHLVRYNSTTHSPDGDEYRLTMHDGTVRDLCFIDDTSSGATLLLSAGGGDNKIYVTDCDTVTPFQSMAGHTQMVMALHHWSGASFVSASYDRTIRIWDLRTRACTSIISAPPARGTGGKWAGPGAPVCSVRVDPSGRLLASGHSDSTCMLYDIRGARVIQAFKPHDDEIRTVSFSPKSYYLLTASYDGRIVLSDLQGDLTQPLPSVCVAESDDKIVQSKWHPTDFTFITTSADKTATLWALPAE